MFVPSAGPLNQGDIFIAPIARVCAADYFVPDRWDRVDQDEHVVDRSRRDGEDIHVVSGRAIVMVTSHDCHHDKEWNSARSRLIRAKHEPEEAEALAEADLTLDRHFHASPLVPLEDLPAGERGNYRAGRDQLRYAIARFDSFRSVGLSESIEQAVGRTITAIEVDNSNRLVIDITLDDGSSLQLVQPPTDPDPSGRTAI